MALTGPLKYVNTFVVTAADVAAGSFEEQQLNAGILPPMKFAGETIPFELVGAKKAATVAAVATADASDLVTAQALANQLKTSVNAILTNLKAANLMA